MSPTPPAPAPAPAPPPAPQEAPRRLDGSMSLLVDVMTNTLDEGYAERAARRRGRTDPARAGATGPASGRTARSALAGRSTGVLLLVLLGLLTGTAVAQVRDRVAAGAGLRADLADEVRQRAEESEELEQRATALRAEVAATRDAALEADVAGSRVAERVQALELAAATVPVTGPGVVLVLDDAPTDGELAPDPSGGSSLDGRVLDRDLQAVVNGLWAAGAEAVAVNGVRLSSRAAIRSAGEAVLVDFRPLSPPYRVEAVGRPADLEVGFLDSPAGRSLQALTQVTGITSSFSRADELTLPAATEPQLRAAVPASGPAGDPP